MRNFQNEKNCTFAKSIADSYQQKENMLLQERLHLRLITFFFFHNWHGHFSKIEQVARKVKMEQKWVICNYSQKLLMQGISITYAGDTLTVFPSIEPLTSDLAP